MTQLKNGQKVVTNDQVSSALRSLDDSVRKLEKAVLRPEKSQNDTRPSLEKSAR
jgi:hypothetical protein